MTRGQIKDVVATIQRHGQYPSRAKVQQVLTALHGRGVSTNRLIPLLRELRAELGIPCRPNRQAVLRAPQAKLTPLSDPAPPRTDEAARLTASPAPDPILGGGRFNGEHPTPTLPERCSSCGGSDWRRFGDAEPHRRAFASERWQCLSCRTVHTPLTPVGAPPARFPPTRCDRCRDIRFYRMPDGRQMCFGCNAIYAPPAPERQTP
jgi:hypothetical protein